MCQKCGWGLLVVLFNLTLWLGTVTLSACGRDNRQTDAQAQLTPSASAALAPPPSSSTPTEHRPSTHAASVAIFKNDRLVACVDVSMVADGLLETMALAVDAGMSPDELLADDLAGVVQGGETLIGDYLDQRTKGSAGMMRIAGKPQSIPKACGEQFAGRTTIGKCTVAADAPLAGKPARVALSLTASHYNAEAGDGPARACLAGKGDWWELPKNSLDYKREHSKQAIDSAMKRVAPGSN